MDALREPLNPLLRPRRRARRWVALLLGVVVLGVVAAVAGVVTVGLMLSAPAPATIGAPPAELKAEPVTFASRSGATISGWFIAGQPGGGAVVLMHGVRSNRLSMLRRARLFAAEGFAVLLFDFQAHGESAGSRITFGWREGLDAESAVAWLRQRLPGERVGAIGTSLGGAAALLGPKPLDVDGLVLEAVYPDIRSAITNRIRVVLGPAAGDTLAPWAAWLFELILPPIIGIDPASLHPVDGIARIKVPLLMASGTDDTRTTIAETRAMYARAPDPKWLWEAEGAGHVDLEAFAPEQYRYYVLAFLAATIQKR